MTMPPMGVADLLLVGVDPVDRYLFWLLSHTSHNGARIWRTLVLRECLPASDTSLDFSPCGELLG